MVPLAATPKRVSGPGQNAAVPRLVADHDLVRANSLTSVSERAFGALAQAGGGVFIALVGAVTLFAVNAGTFLVVAGAGVGFALIAAYWVAVPALRRFPAIDGLEPEAFA